MYDTVSGTFYSSASSDAFVAGPVKLPTGYTEVEYIQSTGTQYINTGIYAGSTIRWVTTAKNNDSSANYRIGWGGGGNYNSAFFATYPAQENFKLSFSSGWTQIDTGIAKDLEYHTFDLSNDALKMDGVSYGTGTYNAKVGSLCLFAFHAGYRPEFQCAKCNIKSSFIYDNGSFVRYFIPVTNASNVAGLYDAVSRTFFGNSGTGEFIAGDPV